MSKITKIIILVVIALGIIGAIKMNNTKIPDDSEGNSILVGEGKLSQNFCHNGFSNISSFIKDASDNITGCELVSCDGGMQSFDFSGDPLLGCTGNLENKLSCVIDKCTGPVDADLKTLSCYTTFSATNSACTVYCAGNNNGTTYNVTESEYSDIEDSCQNAPSSGYDQCVANGCVANGQIMDGYDTENMFPPNSAGGTGDSKGKEIKR